MLLIFLERFCWWAWFSFDVFCRIAGCYGDSIRCIAVFLAARDKFQKLYLVQSRGAVWGTQFSALVYGASRARRVVCGEICGARVVCASLSGQYQSHGINVLLALLTRSCLVIYHNVYFALSTHIRCCYG